jgi:ABC-type uncharacterized transport system ATPase subunit
MLKLSGVFKRFGALLAIDNLSVHLDEGEVLGVVSPNGSGKTTMFNILTGSPKPIKGGFSFRVPTLFICKLSNDAVVVSRVHSKSPVVCSLNWRPVRKGRLASIHLRVCATVRQTALF